MTSSSSRSPPGHPPADVVELNRLFAAWVETAYHRRIHTETGQTPLERFTAAGPPVLPSPEQLHEAFLWSEQRTVTKTATVSLHANVFEVDASLVGRRVDVVFDPFGLSTVEDRWQGRPMGRGVPHVIGRHTHPKARPETAPPPATTGIDYLSLLAAQHERHLADQARPIDYSALTASPDETAEPSVLIESTDPEQCPGQLMIHHPESEPPDEHRPAASPLRVTRTPFGCDLAPGMLHRSAGHGEAVARISWCINEKALGVITGEVGSGKTVATRAATCALDASRHSVIYLGNPAVGGRGIYAAIVTALGGVLATQLDPVDRRVPDVTRTVAARHVAAMGQRRHHRHQQLRDTVQILLVPPEPTAASNIAPSVVPSRPRPASPASISTSRPRRSSTLEHTSPELEM